jgi:SEC-C motif-containing protein
VGNIDYIKKTTHKTALEDFDEGAAKSWSKNSEWLGLSIVSTEKGTEDDQDGMVEFVARYKQSGAGKEENHHERGTFKRESGKWLYVDGNIVGKEPFVREAPKIGRNEPCSCGSGKKFKKCCG